MPFYKPDLGEELFSKNEPDADFMSDGYMTY